MNSGSGEELVSIGIPTRNRRQYAMRAVESALSQTYCNIEVIVSDNASTDGTTANISSIGGIRLKVISQPQDVGMAGNFNVCLNAAAGELFLLLSDDDILIPDAIALLHDAFRSKDGGLDRHVGLVWSPVTMLNADGEPLWSTQAGPQEEATSSMLSGLFSGIRGPRLSSVLCRTSDLRRAGGYDEERYGLVCDTANWARAAAPYRNVRCVQNPVVSYTVHGASMTSASRCSDWQEWGANMHADIVEALEDAGDVTGADRVAGTGPKLLAQLTLDILSRGKGRGGWARSVIKEFWRSRSFMMTPYVAKRIMKDGWKLLRLK